MKLPHISIEYRDEETFAPDKVSLSLIFGFGLYWAWVWLVIFNGPLLFYPANPQLFRPLFVATASVTALTLLCYGIFLKQFRSMFSTKQKRLRNRSIGASAVVVGTLLLFLANSMPAGIVVCASGLLNGIGTAILLMSFGVSTSVLDIAEAVSCTTGSFVVAALCFVFIMALSTHAAFIAAALCVVLPLFEFVCLWQCSKHLVDRMEFSTSTLSVHTLPFALHVCGPMLVVGIILGFVRPLALFEAHMSTSFGNLAPFYIVAILLVSALAFGAMIMQRQRNNFMFRTLFPVAALLLVIEYAFFSQSDAFAVFALFCTYAILEMCSWVMLADISQRFRISAFTTFGFGRGALTLGALMGYLISASATNNASYFSQLNLLIMVTLALMLLGMALLPKNIELRNTLKMGHHCPALQGDEQFSQVSDEDFQLASQLRTTPQLHTTTTTAAPQAESETQESVLPGNSAPTARSAETDPNTHSPAEKVRQETIAAIQERIDAEEKEKQRQGRFKRKCAAVADTYLLSRKETEVLFLLAKGRNAAAIQEQLYISAGTANTHMRHIYRKLNVHSQQDLIALVEETEVDNLHWGE